MELSQLPASVIIYAVSSILPAIVAFAILIVVARGRASHLWLVPGWLAAAAIAPTLAVFFGVRLLITTFSAMATSGGGIGAVSAGMWEAMQPSLLAGYVAGALALITVIIAIRAVINAEASATSSAASTIIAIAVLVLAALAVALNSHLFQHLNAIIINVIDPHGPPMTGGVASTSQMLANQLTRAAIVSVGSVLLLLGGVIITAVMDPKTQPTQGFGIFLTFATVLGVIGLVVNVVTIAAWCSRLQQSAITGQVQR
ncbi:MAG: hypothetical protein M3041_13615 [Acidobacteriota bacterium]|nr:hypothetical protein [Acidobacteriota bacterium]